MFWFGRADHGERGCGFVLGKCREDGRGEVDGDADPFLEVEEVVERLRGVCDECQHVHGRAVEVLKHLLALLGVDATEYLLQLGFGLLAAVGKALPVLHRIRRG